MPSTPSPSRQSLRNRPLGFHKGEARDRCLPRRTPHGAKASPDTRTVRAVADWTLRGREEVDIEGLLERNKDSCTSAPQRK